MRYDGLHKRHDWLANTLGRFVDFMPLCSDVSIGLSISRDPVHLTGDRKHPRVRGINNPEQDVTASLLVQGRTVANALGDRDGYVFKSRTLDCGRLTGEPAFEAATYCQAVDIRQEVGRPRLL